MVNLLSLMASGAVHFTGNLVPSLASYTFSFSFYKQNNNRWILGFKTRKHEIKTEFLDVIKSEVRTGLSATPATHKGQVLEY